MKDMFGMMKKVQEMQSKLGLVQAELEVMEVSGQSGGGLVSVVQTVKGQTKSITIDPSLLNADEKEIVEDLIVAALNDARATSGSSARSFGPIPSSAESTPPKT